MIICVINRSQKNKQISLLHATNTARAHLRPLKFPADHVPSKFSARKCWHHLRKGRFTGGSLQSSPVSRRALTYSTVLLTTRKMKEKVGQKLSSTPVVGRGTGKKTKKVCTRQFLCFFFSF